MGQVDQVVDLADLDGAKVCLLIWVDGSDAGCGVKVVDLGCLNWCPTRGDRRPVLPKADVAHTQLHDDVIGVADVETDQPAAGSR